MLSRRNIRIAVQKKFDKTPRKKSVAVCFFYFNYQNTLWWIVSWQFSETFQNSYFKELFRTAASWRFLVPRKQSPEIVKKAALSGVYIFFNFSEENHSTTDGFLRILWNVLEQLFQRTLSDGCFWEYLGECCRSLNKDEGCSSSTLTGKDSFNKVHTC